MSPVSAIGVANSRSLLDVQAAAASPGFPRAVGSLQQGSGNASEQLLPQGVGQPISPASNSFSSGASPSVDALRPKLEYAGDTLSDLNARVATLTPAGATQSLQNRLDLLNTQFRDLGNHLQESAAKDDPLQMLRLQNDIYQLDEELELVSKVVDQTTSGVRSLLQTQL